MQNEQYTIKAISLDTPVPDMSNWTIKGLVRWYKRTKSLRNQEAVFKELQCRGHNFEYINDLLQ